MLSILMAFLIAAQQRPSFEVASIKAYVEPAPGTPRFMGFRNQPGGRLNATGVTLKLLITYSYGIRDFQVAGGPDWINADRWEIVAKAEDASIPPRTGPPDPTVIDPMRLMLQTLLEDRFQLKMHRETKELPTYDLVVAKSGAKIQLSPDQTPPKPPEPGNAPPPPHHRLHLHWDKEERPRRRPAAECLSVAAHRA